MVLPLGINLPSSIVVAVVGGDAGPAPRLLYACTTMAYAACFCSPDSVVLARAVPAPSTVRTVYEAPPGPLALKIVLLLLSWESSKRVTSDIRVTPH